MMRQRLGAVLAALAIAVLAVSALAGSALAQEAAAVEQGHDFVSQFSIFVLAVFVGYFVVWSVTPALAVAVEAGDASAGSGHWLAKLLGLAALIMASINIFGGFLVTQRMLGMYQKKK